MKKILLFISVFTGLFAFAQTAAKWENVYGQGGNEYGYRVRSCLDQGYIVAGSTSSAGISDGYLVRVDSLGLMMWSKSFGGNNVDVLRSIRQLPDSGYVLAGYSNSQGYGGYDGWVLRTDKNGDTLWTKYIGTSDWDFFYDVTATWDGGFLLAGGTYGLGAGDEDMYFVKIDGNGDTLWTKTYGGIKADEARSICETGDSLIAAAGFTYSLGDTLGDSWVLRMNGVGDTLWTRTLGQGANEDKAWGICDLSSYGRIFVAGETSAAYGDPDAYFKCFTYAGAALFMEVNGGQGSIDYYSAIVARPNATFAALGTTENVQGNGNGDMYFYHDRNGPFYTSFGTFSREAGYSVDLTHDDGYILCGYTEGFNSFIPNVWLIKTDTSGLSTGVLSIRELPSPLSSGATSTFPNPASSMMSITFDASKPISGKIQGEIFDLSGRKIMDIPYQVWQVTSSRAASCSIETGALADGIYHYSISDSEGGKCSGKFIVAH
ncbi:MAG: T9SS type A sorting domain-containing protein [Bacteroidota bacterium]|nr:T9SS type A sorting domain-containing protein [Bacteroidota bacterium]